MTIVLAARFWKKCVMLVCCAAIVTVFGQVAAAVRETSKSSICQTENNCARQTKLNQNQRGENVQNYRLTEADTELLEDLERRAFLYFWEQSDAETGLTLDRARNDAKAFAPDEAHYRVASAAATGFALATYCIAAERGWANRAELLERTRRTLRFFARRAFHQRGWFYHWLDAQTGERRWQSEISSIDTALLLAGVLTVRQCFADDALIRRLAAEIYSRVDFRWMLDGNRFLLSHGWRPETGFLPTRWDTTSESGILYLLGIGAPLRARRLSWRSWYAWRRDFIEYKQYRFQASLAPLFIHQYSQAWFDFRGKREQYGNFRTDYFANSQTATLAQREFFCDASREFPAFAENLWGLTASDAPDGSYRAWGAPPRSPDWDGTVVPSAAAGSLMFTPEISLAALREMRQKYGSQIYGRYGFAIAFNPQTGWVGRDVVGIDLGISLLSSENLRSGAVWRWFMRNAEARRALRRARLR
jgi:hypothetical protein